MFRMWQVATFNYFCIYRWRILHFWMFATSGQLDYPGCKASNCWHSFDADIQNGAVILLRSVFQIKASNTLVYITVTIPVFNYLTCKIKNHRHSIDSYFQNGAVSISLSLQPMNVTITLVIHNYHQIDIQLTSLQQQKLFTVHGHWFSECCSDRIASLMPIKAMNSLDTPNSDKITFQ
jgi:hypothetical protein